MRVTRPCGPPYMLRMTLRLLTLLCLAGAPAALAQPFDPGPAGTPVGSSMAGARIGGAPAVPTRGHIPNADVFGDTVEERTYGRDYDNSYLTPDVPQPDADGTETELEATRGRSDLNTGNAGAFARSDPSVINESGVSRPALGGRARIVPNKRRATTGASR